MLRNWLSKLQLDLNPSNYSAELVYLRAPQVIHLPSQLQRQNRQLHRLLATLVEEQILNFRSETIAGKHTAPVYACACNHEGACKRLHALTACYEATVYGFQKYLTCPWDAGCFIICPSRSTCWAHAACRPHTGLCET